MRLTDEEYEKVKGYVKEVRGGGLMQDGGEKAQQPPPSSTQPEKQAVGESVEGYVKK